MSGSHRGSKFCLCFSLKPNCVRERKKKLKQKSKMSILNNEHNFPFYDSSRFGWKLMYVLRTAKPHYIFYRKKNN